MNRCLKAVRIIAVAILCIMAIVNFTSCGGGGSSVSSNVPVTTTAPADFAFSATSSGRFVAPTQQETITLSVSGLNGFNGDVSVTATLPAGFQSDLSFPTTLRSGDKKNVVLTATSTAQGRDYTLSFQGVSGTLTKTANLPITVIGNGLHRYNVDVVFPSWVKDWISTVLQRQAVGCGAPSDSATINVVLDRTAAAPAYFSSSPTPRIVVSFLPGESFNGNPIADDSYREVILHEMSHAVWDRLYNAPFGDSFQVDEPYGVACEGATKRILATDGVYNPQFASGTYQFTSEFDTYLNGDALKLVATGSDALIEDAAFEIYETARVPPGTGVHDWSTASLRPFAEALYRAVALKETALTRAELLKVFDDAATFSGQPQRIDGQLPSAWLSSRVPYIGQDVTWAEQTYLSVNTLFGAINPSNLTIKAVQVVKNANGYAVNNLTVPVSIQVYDTKGNVAYGPIATDTSKTQFAYNDPKLSQLPYGAYTVNVQATINGQSYTARAVYPVINGQLLLNTAFPSLWPGVVFISVDNSGNAIDRTVSIVNGVAVASYPGVLIVDANPSGALPAAVSVTATGISPVQITQPRPWPRVVPIAVP